MDFCQIDSSARPLYFWAWNDKLNTEYTAEHIDLISACGFGGFCVGAQSGLSTRYLGDEWFRNISVAISKARELNLGFWICDENGSPSGTAGGIVNSYGIEFQQKFLRCEPGEKSNDRTIICKDGYHFYYDTNPYYTDLLNKDAAELFIREAYLPYIEKFPVGITGFISVCPELTPDSFPWSFSLPALYKDAYGEELLDVLTELFRPVGNYKETRIKFWSLITSLLSENYFKVLRSWCEEHNVKFSVIPKSEKALDFTCYGNIGAQFSFIDAPVLNIGSTDMIDAVYSVKASSSAIQFGTQDAGALLLTGGGNSVTFDNLKKASILLFARGITNISLGYGGYSLNGIRKRLNSSYASLSIEKKDAFKKFNDFSAVLNGALSSGEADFDTLLIDNTVELWTLYDNAENEYISNASAALKNAVSTLEKKHIPFHITNEKTLHDFGKVKKGCLILGNCKYKNIILSDNTNLTESTTALLTELERAGVFITVADGIAQNEICDNENIIYTTRKYPERRLNLFVNNSDKETTVELKAGTKMLDPESGEILPFYGVRKFSPYDCLILIDDGTPELPRPFKKPLKTLDLSGDWVLENSSPNVITLDSCDVLLDGILKYERENPCDVTELLIDIKDTTKVECLYSFNIREIPEKLMLVCENSSSFAICVNGILIESEFDDAFPSCGFPAVDILQYVKEGENILSVSCNYLPSEDFNNAHSRAFESESEKTRLTYNQEFEPIYIAGYFSLDTDGNFFRLDKNACRYSGEFYINKMKDSFSLTSMEKQGFPFFAGSLTFKKTVNISDTMYCLKFIPKGIDAVTVEINGQKVPPVLWAPYEVNLSDLLMKGDNEIKITLLTPLRNLFGPHHIPLGELNFVTPGDYYRRGCLWNGRKETPWDSNYCFLEFGLDLLE